MQVIGDLIWGSVVNVVCWDLVMIPMIEANVIIIQHVEDTPVVKLKLRYLIKFKVFYLLFYCIITFLLIIHGR